VKRAASLQLAILAALAAAAPTRVAFPESSIIITPLIVEGDRVPGVGAVTSVGNLAVNDRGGWIVEVDTDHADTARDGCLVSPRGVVIREGDGGFGPAGAVVGGFDSVTLNGAGNSAWNLRLEGPRIGANDSTVFFNQILLLREGDVAMAGGVARRTLYGEFIECKINAVDDVLVMANVDDPTVPGSVEPALLRLTMEPGGRPVDATVIAMEGDHLPGDDRAICEFETGPHHFAFNAAGQVMYIVELAGDLATDHVVMLDDTPVAQEGGPSPEPGRNWLSLTLAEVDLNANGAYVISGVISGATSPVLLIERSGAVYRRGGDVVPTLDAHAITSFGNGPVLIGDGGDVLWYADWDDPDSDRDTGLFHNDLLVVQEGVTIVDDVAVDALRGVQDGYTMSDSGRYVVFEAVLDDGREGAFLVDLGLPACPGNTNTDSTVDIDDIVNIVLAVLSFGRCPGVE
jgi:hypothetical protein